MKLLVNITTTTHPNICSFVIFMTFFQCDVSLIFVELVFMIINQYTITNNLSFLFKFHESAGVQFLRTRTFKENMFANRTFQVFCFDLIDKLITFIKQKLFKNSL